jgi:hypothetical protein
MILYKDEKLKFGEVQVECSAVQVKKLHKQRRLIMKKAKYVSPRVLGSAVVHPC